MLWGFLLPSALKYFNDPIFLNRKKKDISSIGWVLSQTTWALKYQGFNAYQFLISRELYIIYKEHGINRYCT